MPRDIANPGQAHAEILLSDVSVRITRHTLPPGATTGVHTHECDYVVVPVRGGTVRVERGTDSSDFTMAIGVPYARELGVTHSLVNVSDSEIVFVELEYLSFPDGP